MAMPRRQKMEIAFLIDKPDKSEEKTGETERGSFFTPCDSWSSTAPNLGSYLDPTQQKSDNSAYLGQSRCTVAPVQKMLLVDQVSIDRKFTKSAAGLHMPAGSGDGMPAPRHDNETYGSPISNIRPCRYDQIGPLRSKTCDLPPKMPRVRPSYNLEQKFFIMHRRIFKVLPWCEIEDEF